MQEVQLQEVYEGLYDGPHATPKPTDEGPVFLGIKNITEDGRLDLTNIRHISEAEWPKWTKRVTPRAGDIVFSYEATLHRYAIIPEGFRGCLGRRMALIRPDNTKVNTEYLFYYFFSDDWRQEVSKYILTGATVDRIPLTKVPEFKISLPPKEQQDEVAGIISTYDNLIENNNRRIAILEEMAQSLYREWFVKFRFPGHESAKFIDTPLGKIPEGWEVKTLKEALELAYGKALKKDARRGGDVAVYGSGGIGGYHDEALVEGPCIIVGRKGNVGSVFWCDSDCWPIDTVFYVKSDISQYFLYYNLLGQVFHNSDAAVPGLNRESAYSNKLVVPINDILGEFDRYIGVLFKQMSNLKGKVENLTAQRDLLLPKLISGKIFI